MSTETGQKPTGSLVQTDQNKIVPTSALRVLRRLSFRAFVRIFFQGIKGACNSVKFIFSAYLVSLLVGTGMMAFIQGETVIDGIH